MTIHLLTTAEVITTVLHKNNKKGGKKKRRGVKRKTMDDEEDDDEEDDDVGVEIEDFEKAENSIHKESKNTRRNAHYKSTVLVIQYYIIYYAYYGYPPKHVGYQYVIQNETANEYLDANPKLKALLYKKNEEVRCKTYTKLKKINKMKVGRQYLPIQHYDTFKQQYTYTREMVELVDKCMPNFIEYIYNMFNIYCIQFIGIQLVIKHKQKINFEKEKKKKRKPITFDSYNNNNNNTEQNFEESLTELPVVTEQMYNDLKDEHPIDEHHPILGQYCKYTISQLKKKLKEPGVLLKFYQAWLFECDQELLLEFLELKILGKFYYATMKQILSFLMWNIIKMVCIQHERHGQHKNLIMLLQQNQYKQVLNQLKLWVKRYKYCIYDVPYQDFTSDIKSHDLKTFKDLARNKQDIYFHMAPTPVALTMKEDTLQTARCIIKFVEYTTETYRKYIFDLLDVIHLGSHHRMDLTNYSWKQRIDLLKNLLYQDKQQLYTISQVVQLNQLPLRHIQFQVFPGSGENNCFYIRTKGLGFGTLFHFTKNKKIRNSNGIIQNKRFRKVTPRDLILNSVHNDANAEKCDIPKKEEVEMMEPPQNDISFMTSSQQQQTTQMIANSIHGFLSNILNSMKNNSTGFISSPPRDIGISVSSTSDPYASPIPSPPAENYGQDYLGALLETNNTLQFNKDFEENVMF